MSIILLTHYLHDHVHLKWQTFLFINKNVIKILQHFCYHFSLRVMLVLCGMVKKILKFYLRGLNTSEDLLAAIENEWKVRLYTRGPDKAAR